MLTRKQFLRSALSVCAGTLGLHMLASCGNSYGGSSPGPDAAAGGGNCLANGTRAVIATNHGHVLVVTKDDVAAGQAKDYDIHGTADHTHTVSLTAALLGQLAQNQAIMVQSTTDDSAAYGMHSHAVMVACL